MKRKQRKNGKPSYIVTSRIRTRETRSRQSRSLLDFLEKHPVYRAILMTGGLVAVIAFPIDVAWRFLVDRPIQKAEAIARAWDTIANPMTNQPQKRAAFQSLTSFGQSLAELDLRCEKKDQRRKPDKGCSYDKIWQFLNLANSDLRQSKFTHATIKNSTFRYARLAKANFDDADISWVDFRNVAATKAKFYSVNLNNVDFSEAILSDAAFAFATMRHVNFSGADLSKADFGYTQLIFCSFENADLRDAEFLDASIFECNFNNANLKNVWLDAKNLNGTSFALANLSGVYFDHNVSGVQFCTEDGCAENLTQASLDDAWAWSDQPPRFSNGKNTLELTIHYLCDPALREDYNAREDSGIPKGCEKAKTN